MKCLIMFKWIIILEIFCTRWSFAPTRVDMGRMCGETIPRDDRYRQVIFNYDSTNITHRNCKVRVTPGFLKLRDGSWDYTVTGLLLVFDEINLFNMDCRQANLSVTEGNWFGSYDYDYPGYRPNSAISGIPQTLCSNNLPWSDYPTAIITVKDADALDVRFQASYDTPDGMGFELRIVDYYDGSSRCQEGEYRCNNDRCITKSAENSDCDGIDWCTDNTGCTVNVGLIVGLCAGVGSALLGLIIGACLVPYLKRKRDFENNAQHSTYYRAQNISSNRLPARETELARNAQNRTRDYLSERTPNDSGPSAANQASVSPTSASATSNAPPSYSSIWDQTANSDRTTPVRSPGTSSRPAAEERFSETNNNRSLDTGGTYEPPPPEYVVAIHYRDRYKVTESEPTTV